MPAMLVSCSGNQVSRVFFVLVSDFAVRLTWPPPLVACSGSSNFTFMSLVRLTVPWVIRWAPSLLHKTARTPCLPNGQAR